MNNTPMQPTGEIPEEFCIMAQNAASNALNQYDGTSIPIEKLFDKGFWDGAKWAYRHFSPQLQRLEELERRPVWVKCMDRMPAVPTPVPPDTPDERPVIFWNMRHSAMQYWFPSCGRPADGQFPLEKEVNRNLYDEGFGREYWEWLDESAGPVLLHPIGLDKIKAAYCDGFKEAYYSDSHPYMCSTKEIETVANRYMANNFLSLPAELPAELPAAPPHPQEQEEDGKLESKITAAIKKSISVIYYDGEPESLARKIVKLFRAPHAGNLKEVDNTKNDK